MRNTSKLIVTLALLSVGVVATTFGCKGRNKGTAQQTSAAASAAPAPSGSAIAAITDIPGPCGDMIRHICSEAGVKAPACSASQTLGELLADSACSAAVKDIAETRKKLDAMKAVCTTLMDNLCKELGEETDSCKMVRKQTPQFPPDRCQKLMRQYDKVLADLKSKEEKNKPLSAEVMAKIAGSGQPSAGPEDAKVTVVEFSDFQCPYCSKTAKTLDRVKTEYKDKPVRLVFRQFPLNFHKDAHLAAQAALEAHKQGKFWPFHDKLFENQRNLKRGDLEKFAKEVGLDVAAFKAALDGSTYKAAVDADMELGKEVQVTGTPTVFVNGKRIANPSVYENVSKAIDEALGS